MLESDIFLLRSISDNLLSLLSAIESNIRILLSLIVNDSDLLYGPSMIENDILLIVNDSLQSMSISDKIYLKIEFLVNLSK